MLLGVPKEIKNHEYRVGLTPGSVREVVAHGHQVIVQKQAGSAIGLSDEKYIAAGAELVDSAEEVFARAELIVKVKEPQPVECRLLRPDQVLFTYLHLAPDPQQTKLLLESGITAIAYETVTNAAGGLPLLAPMSEVAGRMAIQAGAASLEKSKGGAGILLGGVPGVAPGKVSILGGGVVGYNAALIAVGMGAEVTIIDRSLDRLRWLNEHFGNRLRTLYSTAENIDASVSDADLIVGAALVPGATAPHLVCRQQLKHLRPGSVLVDVSIDQGGCFETSRATTHADPIYVLDDIVHYCVANMPGAVARTSTFALNNATLPYVLALANKGHLRVLTDDVHLRNGLNVHRGRITCAPVAEALGYDWISAEKSLSDSPGWSGCRLFAGGRFHDSHGFRNGSPPLACCGERAARAAKRRFQRAPQDAGPGQNPDKPQPMPNKALPTSSGPSIEVCSDCDSFPPDPPSFDLPTHWKGPMATAMAPAITKAKEGSQ